MSSRGCDIGAKRLKIFGAVYMCEVSLNCTKQGREYRERGAVVTASHNLILLTISLDDVLILYSYKRHCLIEGNINETQIRSPMDVQKISS